MYPLFVRIENQEKAQRNNMCDCQFSSKRTLDEDAASYCTEDGVKYNTKGIYEHNGINVMDGKSNINLFE